MQKDFLTFVRLFVILRHTIGRVIVVIDMQFRD
jgi:hypothetical protein